MKLGEFIKNFIQANSLIRLVHPHKSGHKIIHQSWEDISMEWEVLKAKGKNRHYINNEVLGIASIATGGHYPETINIVIQELENQPLIDEVIEEVSNQCEA
jgi:hypothetical protein